MEYGVPLRLQVHGQSANEARAIGSDRTRPDQVSGRFLQGDLGTPEGEDAPAAALPSGLDALYNVAGLSGQTGAARTLAVNFFGLRALSTALAPKLHTDDRKRPGRAGE